jgi:hypothetical protein
MITAICIPSFGVDPLITILVQSFIELHFAVTKVYIVLFLTDDSATMTKDGR